MRLGSVPESLRRPPVFCGKTGRKLLHIFIISGNCCIFLVCLEVLCNPLDHNAAKINKGPTFPWWHLLQCMDTEDRKRSGVQTNQVLGEDPCPYADKWVTLIKCSMLFESPILN